MPALTRNHSLPSRGLTPVNKKITIRLNLPKGSVHRNTLRLQSLFPLGLDNSRKVIASRLGSDTSIGRSIHECHVAISLIAAFSWPAFFRSVFGKIWWYSTN